jgi:hypothetical protein
MSAPDRPSPLVPVLLAWLVPGLGHLRLGRRWPALFVAASVLPLFVLGMWLAGFRNVSHEREPYYFVLHAFCALPALVADLSTATVVVTDRLPFEATGELYTAVAGLLNLMAVSDVWARCRRGDPEALRERLAGQDPYAPEKLVRDSGASVAGPGAASSAEVVADA